MDTKRKRARQKFVAARIETRSKALARALDTLFNRIARREARLWAQRRTWFRKEFQPEEELELRNLITTFGLRRVDEAGADMAAALGGSWDFTPTMKRDFLKKKEIKIREYVNDRNRELREKVRTVLVQAEAQDPPLTTSKLTEKLYLSLRDQGPFSLGRAERIARTETGQAENYGIFEGMKQSGVSKVEWVAHKGDLRTRPDHAEMHGVQVELGQHFVLPDGTKLLRPCDPDGPPHQIINCFPGNTRVRGCYVAGSKVLYAGKLFTFETKIGYRLSVTPNHPILTDRGWVPANRICKSDKLVCYRDQVEWATEGQHIDRAPSKISEVFGSLLDKTLTCTVAVRATSEDFYGDAQAFTGKVDIVTIDSKLRSDLHPTLREQFAQFAFVLSNNSALSHSAQTKCGDAVVASTSGIPRGLELPLNSIRCLFDTFPFLGFAGGLIPRNDASFDQSRTDCVTRDAQTLRDAILRLASKITFTEVLDIDISSFHGHVYDLESPSGMIIAEGVVTSNCRCQLVPVDFEQDEEAEPETEPTPETPPTLQLVPELQATEAPLLPDSPLRAPEPRAETTTIDILGKEITFTLDHASIAESRSLVMVDADMLDSAWKLDTGFHLPSESQGQSEILGRRERFREFLDENEKINASRVQIDPITNKVSFSDGRHRFAVLRDLGVERLPVAVESDDINTFVSRFAGKVVQYTEANPERSELLDDIAATESILETAKLELKVAEQNREIEYTTANKARRNKLTNLVTQAKRKEARYARALATLNAKLA